MVWRPSVQGMYYSTRYWNSRVKRVKQKEKTNFQTWLSKHRRHLYMWKSFTFTMYRLPSNTLAYNLTCVVSFLLFYTKFTSIIYSAVTEKLFAHTHTHARMQYTQKSWQIFLLVPVFVYITWNIWSWFI